MLLNIYKTNKPIILLLLPVVAVLFWFPNFNTELIQIEHPSPVFHFFVTSSIFLNKIIGLVILITTAFILNITINKNEFFQQNYYIPSLIYVVLMCSFPELNTLHPILISNLFLVLTFRKLINIHSQVSCKSEVFDASLFLLISGLFYLPTLFFTPIIWITLLIFRPFNWKEWATPFISLGLFSIYFFASFLFTDKTNFYTSFSTQNFSIYDSFSYSIISYLLTFFIIITAILGIYQIYKKRKSSTIRYKKMTSTILAFLILSVITFIIVYYFNHNLEAALFTFIPFSIAITYFLVYFKNKIITELSLLLLIGLVLLNNYL